MLIIETLWIFWTCYLAFRLSFNVNYKKQEYGAIWTIRLAGFMGLLMALEGFLYYFQITDKRLFYEDSRHILLFIAIAILVFCVYIDIRLLKKAGQKVFAIRSKGSPLSGFTWDMWLVSIVILITLYIIKNT